MQIQNHRDCAKKQRGFQDIQQRQCCIWHSEPFHSCICSGCTCWKVVAVKARTNWGQYFFENKVDLQMQQAWALKAR